MAEDEKGKETEPIVELEQTLTLEEQMEALKTQLTEAEGKATVAEAKATEKEEGFKTLQRRLSEKQKAVPQVSTSGTAQALQEMIGAIEAQASEEVGGINPATQARLNAARQQLAVVAQQAQWERQDAVTNEVTADLRGELEGAGIDPDSSQCDSVWDAIQIAKLSDGKFEKAKSRTSRIIKGAEPKKEEKKVEPELAEDDERVQVAARKLLEKEGKLKTHEGIASGASGSDDEFIKKFSTGEYSSPDDIKRAKEILSKL